MRCTQALRRCCVATMLWFVSHNLCNTNQDDGLLSVIKQIFGFCYVLLYMKSKIMSVLPVFYLVLLVVYSYRSSCDISRMHCTSSALFRHDATMAYLLLRSLRIRDPHRIESPMNHLSQVFKF